MSSQRTQRQWILKGKGSFDNLSLNNEAPIPEIGDHDVLIRVKACSLNYRDLIIAKDQYPFPTTNPVIPVSDGAGEIAKVGSKVTKWKEGDKVMAIFTRDHLSGPLTPAIMGTGLGGAVDGMLQQYVSLPAESVVRVPKGYTFEEAASLPCAAVTAWNALNGLQGKEVKKGEWVLTQGTGGVSLFALQLAKAKGARVVATTSSSDKADFLKSLGADHVINYKDDKDWGQTAREYTTDKLGFSHIVEVGGPGTLNQSVKCVALEGVITIIGFIGKGDQQLPTMLDALNHQCTVRGILVGSRDQFEGLVQDLEEGGIKPVLDKKVFEFDRVKEAYTYMENQNHVGKIVVRVN